MRKYSTLTGHRSCSEPGESGAMHRPEHDTPALPPNQALKLTGHDGGRVADGSASAVPSVKAMPSLVFCHIIAVAGGPRLARSLAPFVRRQHAFSFRSRGGDLDWQHPWVSPTLRKSCADATRTALCAVTTCETCMTQGARSAARSSSWSLHRGRPCHCPGSPHSLQARLWLGMLRLPGLN